MAFVKGVSGNPGGRPKTVLADGTSVKDLARQHTRKALERLVKVLDDPEASDAAVVAAANSILDRGWGRPVQAIGDSDGNALDWVEIIREARSRPASATMQ